MSRIDRTAAGAACALGAFLLLPSPAGRAATYWWDGDALASNNWATVASWNTLADGSGVNPAAQPGQNDIAIFNTTPLNDNLIAVLSANVTISGLVFNSTGTVGIRTTATADRRIFLGEGGITIGAGAGPVTLGVTATSGRVPLSLRAQTTGSTQSWVNNSANLFSLNANNTVITTNTLGAWILGGSGDITMAGSISGSGTNIFKAGSGVLTLSAANTFAGTTGRFTLVEGRVRVGNNRAFSDGLLVLNGGTLSGSDAATARVLTNAYILGGDVTLGHATDSAALTFLGAGTLTGSRSVTVDSGVVLGGAVGDGGGSYSLSKAGAGLLTLAGANTYAGGTAVDSGALALRSRQAQPAAGTVTVGAGAGIALGVNDGDGVTYWTSADVDSLWSGSLAGFSLHADALVGIDTTAGDLTYATAQSTRGLVKAGTNTLTLTGDSTYSGGTVVYNGVLQIGNGGTSGTIGSGLLTSAGPLIINRAGTYTVAAPMNVGSLTNVGPGTVILTNAVTLSGALRARAGTVVLSNATVTTSGNVADVVGVEAGDSAVLRIEGTTGYYRAQNSITLANAAGSTGVVLMTGGTLTNASPIQIGGSGVGSWIQTGGVILNAAEFRTTVQTPGSYGYYQMSGGALTNAGWMQAARGGGWGLIYQDGGAIAVTVNGLIVGNTTSGALGTGVVYMTGGTLTTPAVYLSRAANSRGELSVDGSASMAISGNLVLNYTVGTNIVNLLGGVVTANTVTKNVTGGLSILNFDGGTLAAGRSGTLIDAGTKAPDYIHVYAGGATIDDNGFTVTNAAALLAPAGDGVTTLGLGAASLGGYVGAPYVSIDGGGGAGATAVALFDPTTGSVTGLVVTSPGFGYTSAPTVTLVGGGREDFVVPTVSIGANSSGALTKTGAGTLWLLGTNSYAGGTVLNGGTLAVTNDVALGAAGTALTFNGGALQPGTAMATIDRPILLSGAGALIGSSGFTRSLTGSVSGAGTLTLTGGGTNVMSGHNPSLSGGVVVGDGQLKVIGSSPAGGGAPTVDPLGTGTVTLNGGSLAILDSGDGTTTAQTFQYDNDLVVQTASTILVDRVSGSGSTKTIRMDQLTANANRVLFTNANSYILFFGGSGGASVINTNVTFDVPASTVQFGTNNSTTAIGQALTDGAGSFGLTKTGAGNLTLGGTHIDGVLTVNAGTLQLNATNNLLPGGIVLNGGTLLINAQDGVLGAPSSPDVIVNGGTIDLRTSSGSRRVGFDIVSNATMNLRSTGNTIFTNESLAIGPAASAFTLNVNRPSGTATGITLTFNGPVTTAGPLTFNVTGGNSYVAAISGAVASVTLGGDIVFNPTSAPLVVSPGISDGGNGFALTKNGTGLLTLNGTNTYSGTTTILNGTLALGARGSISNSPRIAIAAGKLLDVSAVTGGWTQHVNQTVSGTGSIRGDATVLRGRIEPGASPGTLTYSNNLSLTEATIAFDLSDDGAVGGGVNDLIDVKGSLTLTGVSTNILTPWDGPLASSYTLFTYGGTLTGGAGNLVGLVSGVRAGYTLTFDTLGTPGSIVLNVSGAPASQSLTWAAGSGAWDVDATANWAGGERFFHLDSVTFDNSGAAAGVTNVVTVDTHVTPGGIVVNSDRDYSIAGAGEIGGTGGLTKDGAGLLLLGTSNSFLGTTAILDGRVVLGNGYALQGSTVSNAVAGGLGIGGVRSVVLAGLSGAGDIALTNDVGQGVSLTVGGNGASTTFGGTLNDQGLGGSLTKVGSGTLALTGAVNVAQGFTNYAGTVVFGAAGTNSVGSDVRVGFGAGSSATVVQNDGIMVVNGGNGMLLGNGAGSGASGSYILNGGTLVATPASANRGVILGVNRGTTGTFHLVDGVVTGKILEVSRSDAAEAQSVGYYYQSGGTAAFATVTIAGGSAVNSSNSTAWLAISNGTFLASAIGGLASGNDSTGRIYLGTGARAILPAFPTARGTNAYSEITFDGGTLSPLASSAAYLQNLTHAYLTTGGATFDVGSGLAITVTQGLENAGADAGTLRKAGMGVLTLAGANTFNGGVTVSNGVVSFATTSAMPAGGTVTGLAGAVVGLGVGGAGFYGSADVDSLWDGTMAGVTLEPGARVGIDTAAGDFTYGTSLSGARGLAKVGSGTLILTGVNTFSGGIVLYGGTLDVTNDSALGASGSGLAFRGGTLQTSGDMTLDDRGVTLDTYGTFSPDAATTLTITNAIDGAGALLKAGAGRLVLAGASSYAGGTTNAAGTLALGGDNVLGSGTLVLTGGTLASDGMTARALTNAVRITAAIGMGDSVNTGRLVLAGPVDFAGAGRTITNLSDVAIAGPTASGGLTTKRGAGTLSFIGGEHDWSAGGAVWIQNGSLVFDGATVTNADALRIGSQTALGTSRLVVTNGAVFISVNSAANIRVGYTGGNTTATNILDVAGRITMNTSAAAGKLQMGEASGRSVVNLLSGGEIEVALVSKDAGGGFCEVNFDGGILRAMEDSAAFLTGLDGANLLSGGAFFDVQSYNITVGQPLQGAGGLTKLGSGVLTLGGTNTYAGFTAVSSGALSIASSSALPGWDTAGRFAVSNGAVLATGSAVTDAEVATMLGTGNFLAGSFIGFDTTAGSRTNAASIADLAGGALGLAKVGTGTLVLTNANSYTGGTWIFAGGALQVGDGGTYGSLGGGSIVDNGALVFNRSDAVALSTAVTGTGTLTQAGSGTLLLNAAQLYTGSTTVRQGVVTLGLSDALPTATALVLGEGSTGGTFDLGAYDQTIGTLSVSSTNGAATNNLVIGAGRTLTVAGNVAVGANVDNSSANLIATGGGTLIVNTNGGTFRTSLVTLGTDKSGRTMVDFSGLGAFLMDLGTGSMTISTVGDNSGSDRSTLILAASNVLRAASITIGGANNGSIQQLRLGSGTNILYTDNLNLGSVNRDSGQLLFNDATGGLRLRDSSGAGRVNVAIGTNNNGTGYTAENIFNVTGHEADLRIGSLRMGEYASRGGAWTNTFAFDQGLLDVTSVEMAIACKAGTVGNSRLLIGGGMANLGSVSLSTSSATGTLAITGGTVTLGGDIVKGVDGRAVLTLNGGTLDMQSHAIGSSAAPIDVVGLYAGTLRNVGEINGGAPLTKTTPGVLTLEGANSCAANLTVAAGTLRVNGSYTGGGLIAVQGGATLMGTGTVGAVTVAADAVLKPGNSVGTLTTADLTLDGGAALEYELRTTGTSDLILAGAVNLGGIEFADFTFIPGVGFGPGAYILIDATDISGLGAGTAGTIGSYDAELSIDGDAQDLVLTVIPEPASLGLLGVVGVAGWLLRRRTR